jgi:Rad3-related DNA helicase
MILTYFASNLTPRPQQVHALTELERLWSTHDVFVVNMPVGAGKSRVITTLANWLGEAAILAPNNVLVNQYKHDFPDLPTLAKKSTYYCARDKRSCETTKKKCERYCDNCPLLTDTKTFYSAPIYLANYYTYLAHKQWRSTLIVDEAHNLLKMLTEDAAKRVWKHKDYYPPEVQTYEDVLAWLETKGPKYKKLLTTLKRDRMRSLCQRSWDYYRGEYRECLKFTPIDAREQPPVLWNPYKVKKIVLVSATIGPSDIYDLGLDRRRVAYITTSSPIASYRRPVVIDSVGSINYQTLPSLLPRIADKIKAYTDANPNTKGLVHLTYAMAKPLKDLLADNPRFLWHDTVSKSSVLQKFINAQDPYVLMASGMTEGVDLSGDKGRWQIITKIPFLSLADPAIDHKRRQRPDWYAWQAILAILQASGRICRGPVDKGATVILDGSFYTLWNKYRSMFPVWFQEAVDTGR